MPPRKLKKTPISMLTDVCLFKIFSYLPLEDVLVLERVCKKFKKVAQMVFKHFRTLKFDKITEYSPTYEIEWMCSKVGPYITSLTLIQNEDDGFKREYDDDLDQSDVEGHSSSFAIRALKCCKNLEYLHLKGFDLGKEDKDLLSIFRKHKNLNTVKLEEANLTDNMKKCFKVAKNLQVLSLSGNGDIDGHCLVELRNIKELNLAKCSKLHPDDFMKFCKENPDLINLDISYCDKLNQKCYNTVVNSFKDLKHLSLGFAYEEHRIEYSVLAKLKNLTHLTLCSNRKFGPLIQILAEKKTSKLEYLNISCTSKDTIEAIVLLKKLKVFITRKNISVETLLQFRCYEKLEELHISAMNLPDSDLARVINMFPSLKYLNIEGSQSVTNNFINKHLPELKARKKVLEINITDTRISPDLIKRLYQPVDSSGNVNRPGTSKAKSTVKSNPFLKSKIKFIFN